MRNQSTFSRKNGQPRRSSVCDLLVKPTWHSSTASFVAFRARHADRDRRDFIELRVDVGGVGDDGNDGRDGRVGPIALNLADQINPASIRGGGGGVPLYFWQAQPSL